MAVGEVDPQAWKACAGAAARFPAVGSRVYYFPQGHAEQASSPVDIPGVVSAGLLCRVSAVRLLADVDTDEVFARISLDHCCFRSPFISSSTVPAISLEEDGGCGGFVSFSKILTASDANNGGGFSVPKFCAESILPPLNYEKVPTVQIIHVRDLHGVAWSFRHIYRGTPRRHLLTTGWCNFVKEKKLVAGDSIVFMKNLSGQLLVGIRRTSRSCGLTEYPRYYPKEALGKIEKHSWSEGFSRDVKGKVPASSVVEAFGLAGKGMPFEVLYYPMAGFPVFVVAEETVDAASKVRWTVGARVRISVETEGSARMSWFYGTVSKVSMQRSPWRMLQVSWDEPEVLQNARTVNPWQLELICDRPQLDAPFLPPKRLKGIENSESRRDILVEMTSFQMIGSESGNRKLFDYNLFPASMQGARQDSVNAPSVWDCVNHSKQVLHNGLAPQKNGLIIALSTEINTQSGDSCPPSDNSTQTSDGKSAEPANNQVKVSTRSLRLFGKVIHMELPHNGKCLDFKSIKVSEFSLEGYNASDSDSDEEKINIKSSAEGPGS
ncbi:hypothetical protein ZIOFF_026358 [Zingiber officinale]|uniref:Auxin response factor n=1 Tax=Zingiber officinale TaxID=94328 RepID=A0A8J5LHW9_ZINOF|nr:hypothetical protein ZIOFF_026358 [Zingiber officinale]